MQAEMAKAQEQLKDEIVEASAGGGMVKVTMTGDMQLREIKIDPDAIDPEDVEMLQDMVAAAVNEALRSAQELAANRMGGIAGASAVAGSPACPGCRATLRPWLDQCPPPVSRLIAELSKLPGIGQRTAQRLAFHILRSNDDDAFGLADAIREVKEKVGLCEVCFNLAEGPRCGICEDTRRDQSLICVVEEPADVIPIERTGEYRGLYHVLGGALSPIDGIDPEDLKIAELVDRVNGEIEEVVLATNPTTTGEATALHIADALRGRVAITRLASGLPVGADLEHADEVTLGKALAGRQASASQSRRAGRPLARDTHQRANQGVFQWSNQGCSACILAIFAITIGSTATASATHQRRRFEEEVQEDAQRQEEVQEAEEAESGRSPAPGHPRNVDLVDGGANDVDVNLFVFDANGNRAGNGSNTIPLSSMTGDVTGAAGSETFTDDLFTPQAARNLSFGVCTAGPARTTRSSRSRT